MKFILNLWLEQKNPLIQLLDAVTGDVVLQWRRDKVFTLLDAGEICLEDLVDESLSPLERLGLVKEF
ncbi:MAG: hypothetical protein HOM11_10710 [Methylococcales bacterium]|jgi:hypothetical protein|nr:hypothetical protein [Methylococcales bacterium]MBT7444484.1 hypothetical protein [Methylococcales bacterium]